MEIKFYEKQRKGISIIEAVVSFAIISITLSSISSLYFLNLKGVDTQKDHIQTIFNAEAAIHNAELNLNEDSLANFEMVISTSSNSVQLSTIYTDWKNAEGGSTCDLATTSKWTRLNVTGSIDIGATNTATSLVARGEYVFLVADSPTRSDKDFFIVDVSDLSFPHIVSSLDTGPGLTSIKIAGNYAYLGNSSINGQLQIVDIHNPLLPTLVTTYKLPGIYNDATTIPSALFYSRGLLFLGTRKSQIAELHIIDVHNVHTPHELGTFETNTQINDLLIKHTQADTFAYIASPDSNQLMVLNVTDPTHIFIQSTFAEAADTGHGRSLFEDSEKVYLSTTQSLYTSSANIYILPATTTSPIRTLGSIHIGSTTNALIESHNLLFASTQNMNDAFQIWNVADASKPYRSMSGPVALPTKSAAMSCSGNTFFFALQSSDALRIVTSMD